MMNVSRRLALTAAVSVVGVFVPCGRGSVVLVYDSPCALAERSAVEITR